jgi:hypothetical protein
VSPNLQRAYHHRPLLQEIQDKSVYLVLFHGSEGRICSLVQLIMNSGQVYSFDRGVKQPRSGLLALTYKAKFR